MTQNGAPSTQRAREIALRALAGDYDLLLACRDLSNFGGQLPGVGNDLMDVFVGVASEIDDLPIGAERSRWSAEVLAAKDVEAGDYRLRVRQVVTEALRRLLVVLGAGDHPR